MHAIDCIREMRRNIYDGFRRRILEEAFETLVQLGLQKRRGRRQRLRRVLKFHEGLQLHHRVGTLYGVEVLHKVLAVRFAHLPLIQHLEQGVAGRGLQSHTQAQQHAWIRTDTC